MIASSRGVLKGPLATGNSEYGSWPVSSSHIIIPIIGLNMLQMLWFVHTEAEHIRLFSVFALLHDLRSKPH